MTAFLMNALVTLLVGTQLQSTAIILLGLAQIVLVVAPFKLICELFGWAFEKGIDLVEFAGTLAASQILPLLAGITVGNVKPFDIADQQKIRAFIRNAPNAFIANALSIFAWVLVSPTPEMLTIVTLAATVSTIVAVPYMLHDGSPHVKATITAFFKLQYAVVPTLVVGRVLWELIPETGGQFSNLKNSLKLLWKGREGLGVLDWGGIFLMAAISLTSLWLFSGKIREWLTGKGWVSDKFAAFYGLLGLVCSLGLVVVAYSAYGQVYDAKTIRLPKVLDAAKAPKPPTNVKVFGTTDDKTLFVRWKDETEHENGHEVQVERGDTKGFYPVEQVFGPNRTESFISMEKPMVPGETVRILVVAVGEDGASASEPVSFVMPEAQKTTVPVVAKAETVTAAAPPKEEPVAVAEKAEDDSFNYGQAAPGWDDLVKKQKK
jgi:hypothetical protein